MPKQAPLKPVKIARLPDALSLFKPSWQAFKFNLDTFALQILFPLGLTLLSALLIDLSERPSTLIIHILTVCAVTATVVGSLIIAMSLIVVELRSAQNKKLRFEQAIHLGLRYFWRLLGLLLLSGLIIVIGLILLIVPGLFAIQRLLLAPYVLVDQNTGIIEAMRRSNAMAKKYSGEVWGVVGILIAINLLALIPVLGWPVAVALTIAYLCAPAIRYLQLKNLGKA